MYYIINNSIDSKEIGKQYPQIQSMINGYNYLSDNSVFNLKYNELSNSLNLNSFQLHPQSKLTDVLSASVINFGIIMNQRVRDIIAKFSVPEINCFYAASIANKTQIYNNYYYFHFISDLSDVVDFKQTYFYAANSLNIIEKFQVSSVAELRQKEEQYFPKYEVRTDKYVLNKTNSIPYDIFRISFIDSNTYISHRLKTALEEAQITGIEIVPADVF